jgi:hypothetical protein
MSALSWTDLLEEAAPPASWDGTPSYPDFAGERGPVDPTFDVGGRLTYMVERDEHEIREPAPIEDSHLVSSEVRDTDLHMPCIDIDVPIRVVESSTPGHGHLYIDHAMSWEHYDAILQALVAAGVVEQGYYDASVSRGATHLRLPWVRKPQPEAVPFQ